MKEFTWEELHRIYDESDREELHSMHDRIAQSRWRTRFHIQTVTGLMNDPNGFVYHKGIWHMFYQWFPYGGVHGMKHWYHVTSPDLLHWKNEGLGLKPSIMEDNSGCYSGSALVKGNDLYFAYTGNHRTKEYKRVPYQIIAKMKKDGTVEKLRDNIVGPHPDYTEHQRDPKLFYRKEDGLYWFMIGAQDRKLHGKLLLYSAPDPEDAWTFRGEIKVRGYDHFGYMAECPDIERIGDKWLLLFSPQGLDAQGDCFRNKFNNVYMIGDLNFETLEFIPDGPYQELDRGLDFYAAQCAFQDINPEAMVLAGWFGVSDYTYPMTSEEDYCGLITMPRIMTIENGKLRQRPLSVYKTLRKAKAAHTDGALDARMPEASVIDVKNRNDASLKIALWASDANEGFTVCYDTGTKALAIDRKGMENQVNTEFGTGRCVILENGLSGLEIYADTGSIEIFVNDGEYVLSARVFPTAEENRIRVQGDADVTVYEADTTVKDSFVI